MDSLWRLRAQRKALWPEERRIWLAYNVRLNPKQGNWEQAAREQERAPETLSCLLWDEDPSNRRGGPNEEKKRPS